MGDIRNKHLNAFFFNGHVFGGNRGSIQITGEFEFQRGKYGFIHLFYRKISRNRPVQHTLQLLHRMFHGEITAGSDNKRNDNTK